MPRSSPPLPRRHIQRQQEPGNDWQTVGGNSPPLRTLLPQSLQTDDDLSEGGISVLKSRRAIVSFDTDEGLGSALIAQPEQETSFSRRLREQGILKAGARIGTSGALAEEAKAGSSHRDQSATFGDIDGLNEGRGPMWDSGGGETEGDESTSSSLKGYGDGHAFSESQGSGSDEFSESSEGEEGEGREGPGGLRRGPVPESQLEMSSVLGKLMQAGYPLNIVRFPRANSLVQNLMEYLMGGEELALEMIGDFVAQGEKVIQTLADSHSQEHQAFLSRIEEIKKVVAKKTRGVKQMVENTVGEIEKGRKELEGGKREIEREYERLGDDVERMLGAIAI